MLPEKSRSAPRLHAGEIGGGEGTRGLEVFAKSGLDRAIARAAGELAQVGEVARPEVDGVECENESGQDLRVLADVWKRGGRELFDLLEWQRS